MKKSMKKIAALLSAAAMCTSMLTACGDKTAKDSGTGSTAETEASQAEVSAEGDSASEGGIKAVYGEIRTEYNTDLDLSDYPLTASDIPADYSLTLEAENGTFIGGIKSYEDEIASGGGYVNGLNTEGDELRLSAEIEYSGFYRLNFRTKGPNDHRVNNVVLDGEKVGEITTAPGELFSDSIADYIYISAGTHDISLTPSWGYIDIDSLILTPSSAITEDTYRITKPLSNPNADERTKSMYKFLCDVYGKYSLSGQYADKGRQGPEFEKITACTGKTFAVLGLDMMDYSLGREAHGSVGNSVEYAYDWYNNAGGIVQMCWHWSSPDAYAKNDAANPWYSSFYKEGSNLDLDKIMNGEDDAAYQALMEDIDHVSGQLARLRDAGVPVLWRPLHEASGGWFWWGDCEPESYKKLWNVMYDKMTNEHNLTNLIWVWNGQNMDWYPGDETVDIVGWDIYAGNNVDTSQSGRFADMANNYGSETKLIALTENGCVMDPDKVFNDNARWLFWGTWSDPFTLKLGVVINEEYTTKDLLKKAYNSDRVLTLDELPDLKNYQ